MDPMKLPYQGEIVEMSDHWNAGTINFVHFFMKMPGQVKKGGASREFLTIDIRCPDLYVLIKDPQPNPWKYSCVSMSYESQS